MEDRKKILVVDDERFNIKVLSDLLKSEYKVMAAINGQQALKAASTEKPPDLIILDVMMPEMDGYEVCRTLKADETTRDIPVIFVSGMEHEADRVKAFEEGAVAFFTKPISPDALKESLREYLA